jgi:hypothetical protein
LQASSVLERRDRASIAFALLSPSSPTPISVTELTSFFGFDMIVLATDSFFMAMYFFLSGLFAWFGIARRDR